MGLCKDGYYRESERYEGKKYIGFGKTQKEAMKSLAKKIADAKAGTTVINKNTTVSKWADTWLETFIKESDITYKSYLNIKGKIERNVTSAIGTMKMKDVKDLHLQKILNEQKDMSSSHVTKLRAYMQKMFKQAVKSRVISFSPAEDLTLPRAADKKRRALTSTEREAILALAENHPAGLWVKTMLYCGLRPGETIALQWKDIDFKASTVNVHQALESGTPNTFKGPKSDAGYRVVPIPEHLLPAFRQKKGGPLEYIFTQQLTANKGKHHTESSLRCFWSSFKRALDIQMGATVKRNQIVESKVSPDLVPYIMRHTYGTDLQAAGVPINIAKYLMGHSDIAVTANIYTHENEGMIATAADLINKASVKNVVKSQKSKAV